MKSVGQGGALLGGGGGAGDEAPPPPGKLPGFHLFQSLKFNFYRDIGEPFSDQKKKSN